MIQSELIQFAIAALEGSGVPYMITGSVAANAHGRARTTHDVDVVVAIEPKHVPVIKAAFPPPRFFLQEESVRRASIEGGMFNAIDEEGVGKIDFWVLNDDVMNQRAFWRKIRMPILDVETWVPRPEDLILLKLKWSKQAGGSQKQMEDCAELLRFSHDEINLAETDHWALRVGVGDEWRELRRLVGV